MKKMILSLILLPAFSFAFADKSDFEFYKEIKNEKPYQLNYFDIDFDLESNSKKYLNDLRIFYKDREVPYEIIKERDIYKFSEKRIQVKIIQRQENTFILDLNKENDEYLNKIYIETDSTEFRRVVSVWGADLKEGPWEKLNIERNRGNLVYDLPEGRDFEIDFKYSNYKYLKIGFVGDEGGFDLKDFYRIEKKQEVINGEKEFLNVVAEEISAKENVQTIIFDTKKDNLFFDQVRINVSDKRFSRSYILYAADSRDAEILESLKRFDKNKDYWVEISSGKLNKEIYTDNPVISLKNNKRYYRLDIDNGDNEKLKITTAVFEKFKKKVYFKLNEDSDGLLRVYYSSDRVKAPNYDFVIDKIPGVASKVNLGPEIKNPDFVKDKKSIFEDNSWLIYLLIVTLIFVLGFFVYKILKESNNKTDRKGIQI